MFSLRFFSNFFLQSSSIAEINEILCNIAIQLQSDTRCKIITKHYTSHGVKLVQWTEAERRQS